MQQIKGKSKALLSAILIIALCISLLAGATYALFTSEQKVNIAVTSGKVSIDAQVQKMTTFSDDIEQLSGTFANGGTATIQDNNLILDKIMPMDKVTFEIALNNNSNVNVKYQTKVEVLTGLELFEGLSVTVDGNVYNGMTAYSAWTTMGQDTAPISITVELPKTAGNEYQDKSTTLAFTVTAIQGNADVTEEEAGVTYLYSPIDMRLFAKSVNNGNSFDQKTVKLMNDIDLANEPWTPIGRIGKPFSGDFDGNGKTISNLKIDSDKSYVGLFGLQQSGAKNNSMIRNVNIQNADVRGLTQVGALAGSAYTGAVDNCHVSGTIKVSGHYKVGGLTGEGYAKITNCSVIGDQGSLVEGTFRDASNNQEGDNVGGLIGFTGEGVASASPTLRISDCNVAIDVVGTRKVGGVIGYLHMDVLATKLTYTGTVSCNADAAYTTANKVFIGGLVGEYGANAALTDSTVTNSALNGNVQDYTGELVGGTRHATYQIDITSCTATNCTVTIAQPSAT